MVNVSDSFNHLVEVDMAVSELSSYTFLPKAHSEADRR
jgi:hypothetical protein